MSTSVRESSARRLAGLRLLIGGFAVTYLVLRLPHFLGYAGFSQDRFEPIGVVSLLNTPLSPRVHHALYAATLISGIAFVLGRWFKYTGPVFALLLLWVLTYRNSWSMVFHTENLLALHVLLLALAPAADVWSLDAHAQRALARSEALLAKAKAHYTWAIFACSLLTVLTYAVAGVAKLKNAGIDWAMGDVLRAQVAYDNLRKIELGSFYSPLGAWLVRYAFLFPPLASLSLAVELLAPLSLIHPRLGKIWALMAWSFHVGVLLLMAIVFPYQLFGFAYLSFFRLEKFGLLRRVGLALEQGRVALRLARDR